MAQSLTLGSSIQTVDDVLNQVLAHDNSDAQLAAFFRNIVKLGENGEYLLAGTLSQAGGSGTDGGVASGMTTDADPLSVLDPCVNTLGYLYILCVFISSCVYPCYVDNGVSDLRD